jgi:hypothetical protein
MKSFPFLFRCLLLGVSAAGCFVPELPEDTVFSCDVNADCTEQGEVCVARAGLRGYCCKATPEVCNGRDDDCDSLMDEGFDLMTDRVNCGQCGIVCNAETQICKSGSCQARGR